MSIGKRLKQFAENNFSSHTEFAKAIEIGRVNLYRYFNDTVLPGSEILQKLASMGCDLNWLLTGEFKVNSINKKIEDTVYIPIESAEINSLPRFLEYPFLGSIPAGNAEIVDLNDWVQKMVIDYSPNDHALLMIDKEFGYSMTPIIQPGDIALISFSKKPEKGRPVAARWDETKGAIKILNYDDKAPNVVWLHSSNSAEPSICVEREKVKLYPVVAFFLTGRIYNAS
ncbi:MAG TPA: S24 family peptidase [Melioribacteraceae bacterium]|nr:S24 family peptidase [Melioribacteraceae bacterium]